MRYKGIPFGIGAAIALITAIAFRYYLPEDSTVQKHYIEEIEDRLTIELATVQNEAATVVDALIDGSGKKFSSLTFPAKYPYYIYKNKHLFYWSEYHYVPQYRDLKLEKEVEFLSTEQGKFLVFHRHLEGYIDVVSLLPLYWHSRITNRYVGPRYNEDIFKRTNITILDDTAESDSVYTVKWEGTPLFNVQVEQSALTQDQTVQNITTALILISIFLASIMIIMLVKEQLLLRNFTAGFFILLVGIFTIRALMLAIGFPIEFSELELFDPKFFVASTINPSLGDFLINVTINLVLIWYIYKFYYRTRIIKWLLGQPQSYKNLMAMALIFIGVMLLCLQYLVFQSVYYNSQLSFDITKSINFTFLRTIAFAIFVINAISFFLLYHVLFRIINRLVKSKEFFLLLIPLGSLFYLPIALTNPVPFWSIVILHAIYFCVLFFLNLPHTLIKFRYSAFLYLFICALISSLVGAIAIQRYESERDFSDQQRFANLFLVENDPPAELLLSEIIRQIQNDVFITTRLSNPFLSKNIILEKIDRAYLTNYLDRYDAQVYLYNANGEPIEPVSTVGSYTVIESSFAQERYQTDFENIYFVNRAGADVTKRYLAFITAKRYGIKVGHIIIDLNLKKILPRNVYPELLVDSRFLQPFMEGDYSYAVINNQEIIYSSGDFNYGADFDLSLLEDDQLFEEGLIGGGYLHLGVVDQDQRTIIVSSSREVFWVILSNFSFFFLLMIILILLFIGLYTFVISVSRIKLNYSAKIQLNLNIAFFTPLFIVSFITLSLITSSLKNEINSEYISHADVISSNIVEDLDQYLRDVIEQEEFSSSLARVAKIIGNDINVFNITGRLIATSQPRIYQNNLLSEYINPAAMADIMEQGRNSVILEEEVGSLNYNNTYMAIKSYETGNIMAILSVPFFESGSFLEDQQINVFTTVLNIFSSIFIIFLAVSYFVSKWLTLPLSLITQKIRRTTLTDNEPLEWRSDDEIGLMVAEYNRMLINLEASKKALSRTEKESAWREIAQQVAHEIKNPLTPMKLTLQQLERSLSNAGRDKSTNVKKPIRHLLHQVDTLSDIATSFSTFAKMPIPEHERFELTQCLRRTFGLYRNTKNAEITYLQENDDVFVYGDEQLMSRIISNILINSIQSVDDGRPLKINGKVKVTEGDKVLITISDNGCGIPGNIQDKVFVPNFSTKDTGSGIGLSIAKHGIEHAGGNIWFESKENVGTTFYIELPVVQ